MLKGNRIKFQYNDVLFGEIHWTSFVATRKSVMSKDILWRGWQNHGSSTLAISAYKMVFLYFFRLSHLSAFHDSKLSQKLTEDVSSETPLTSQFFGGCYILMTWLCFELYADKNWVIPDKHIWCVTCANLYFLTKSPFLWCCVHVWTLHIKPVCVCISGFVGKWGLCLFGHLCGRF